MKTIALINKSLKKIYLNSKVFKTIYYTDNNALQAFDNVLKTRKNRKVIVFDHDGYLPFLYFCKQQGICCSYPLDKEIAKLSTEHNNAPVMVLPLDFIKKEQANKYIDNFLNSKFEGGRHLVRTKIMLEPWSLTSKSIKFAKNKKIIVACDHAAFAFKQTIINYLLSKGYDVIDVGTENDQSTAYSMYAIALGLYAHLAGLGIAICGTGLGISNTVNKFKGLCACVCSKPQQAKIARSKYGANVLGLGARFTSIDDACKTIDAFLKTKPGILALSQMGFAYDRNKFKKIRKTKDLVVPQVLK